MSIVDTFHIKEGPGYEYRKGDGVDRMNYPFACRLRLHLEKNAAVIGFQSGEYKHGQPTVGGPVGSDRIVHLWNQFHVSQDTEGCAESLGDQLMSRFGKHLTFGEMFLPNNMGGIQWAGWHQSGPVWVRNIGMYDAGSDEVIQRWDVLVRST